MIISNISTLYAFEDGDTISPRMGVIIDPGYGLQQYWDVAAGKVIETDFTKHPATLYPQAYSSRLGKTVVPESVGSGWYYNNPESSAALIEFDSGGKSTGKFVGLFQTTSVAMNGKTFPALKIVGNLANKDDYTDKYIYFKGLYAGKTFTCQQLIPIQANAGSSYNIELSVKGESGPGDAILSNDNDWVLYSAFLQSAGVPITEGVTFEFFQLVDGSWKKISNQPGLIEISHNSSNASVKFFNAAVEGVEIFRVEAHHDGNTYFETFEVTDEHDPFYIVNGRNIPGDAVKPGETVTYSPQIYDRATNEPATGKFATNKWKFSYTFISSVTGKPIPTITEKDLTYENIRANGGITTRIQAQHIE